MLEAEREALDLRYKYGKERALRFVNCWLETVEKPLFGFIHRPKKVKYYKSIIEILENE